MATLYPRLLAPSLRIGACFVQRPGRVPTAWSKLAARRPRTVQHDVVSIPNKVSFTTEAATQRATDDSNSSDASPAKLNFQSPKVEELFQRMSTLSKEEARMAFKLTLDALGIKFAPRDQQRRVANVAVEEPQEQEVKEEKSLFDLKLTGFDAKAKIKVIKEVRAIAGLGLKEAKELVEGAPKVIKKDIKPEQAEELKKKLEDVGATIEIS